MKREISFHRKASGGITNCISQAPFIQSPGPSTLSSQKQTLENMVELEPEHLIIALSQKLNCLHCDILEKPVSCSGPQISPLKCRSRWPHSRSSQCSAHLGSIGLTWELVIIEKSQTHPNRRSEQARDVFKHELPPGATAVAGTWVPQAENSTRFPFCLPLRALSNYPRNLPDFSGLIHLIGYIWVFLLRHENRYPSETDIDGSSEKQNEERVQRAWAHCPKVPLDHNLPRTLPVRVACQPLGAQCTICKCISMHCDRWVRRNNRRKLCLQELIILIFITGLELLSVYHGISSMWRFMCKCYTRLNTYINKTPHAFWALVYLNTFKICLMISKYTGNPGEK